MKSILKLFLVWRLWLFIPLIIFSLFLPFRKDASFTTLKHYTVLNPPSSSDLIYPWVNFDGVHYIAIASRGYVDEGRFMPVFPLVIRAGVQPLSVFGVIQAYDQRILLGGMLISFFLSVGAVYAFYRLLRLDYTEEISQRAVLFLLAFPTAFVLALVYSEGLFLLLSFGALYAARRKKWLLAALVCMVAAVTRLSGILLVIPVLYELYISEVGAIHKILKIENLKKMGVFLVTPVLLALYAYHNYYTWGDPLYFVHAHGALGNSRAVSSMVFPVVTLYRYAKILLTVSPAVYEYWVAVLELVSLAVATFGIWFAWKQQQRTSYLIYAVVSLLLPLMSGTLTGLPRYVLPLFVMYSGLAVWSQKHQRAAYVVMGVGFVVQAVLLGLFVRGYYIT